MVQGFTLGAAGAAGRDRAGTGRRAPERPWPGCSLAEASSTTWSTGGRRGGIAHRDRARPNANLLARRDRIRTTLDGDEPDDSLAPVYRRLRRDLLEVERAELHRLYDAGTIGDAARRRVERLLDLEDAALGED